MLDGARGETVEGKNGGNMEARDEQFRVLDRLIEAGWGEVPQEKISAARLREILAGKDVKPPKGYSDSDPQEPLESPEKRARRKELRAERKRKAEALRSLPDIPSTERMKRRFGIS